MQGSIISLIRIRINSPANADRNQHSLTSKRSLPASLTSKVVAVRAFINADHPAVTRSFLGQTCHQSSPGSQGLQEDAWDNASGFTPAQVGQVSNVWEGQAGAGTRAFFMALKTLCSVSVHSKHWVPLVLAQMGLGCFSKPRYPRPAVSNCSQEFPLFILIREQRSSSIADSAVFGGSLLLSAVLQISSAF